MQAVASQGRDGNTVTSSLAAAEEQQTFKAFRDREKCVRCYSSSRIDSGLVVKEAAEERKRCAAATST